MDSIIRRHKAEILKEYERIQSDEEEDYDNESVSDNSANVNLNEEEAALDIYKANNIIFLTFVNN